MLYKVAVHTDSVFIRIKMNPIGFDIGHTVALLQKYNVTCDLSPRILLEGVVGETDSAYKVSSLCKVFADSGVFLIHRTL